VELIYSGIHRARKPTAASALLSVQPTANPSLFPSGTMALVALEPVLIQILAGAGQLEMSICKTKSNKPPASETFESLTYRNFFTRFAINNIKAEI
jgi:hypothetical protein